MEAAAIDPTKVWVMWCIAMWIVDRKDGRSAAIYNILCGEKKQQPTTPPHESTLLVSIRSILLSTGFW